MKFFRLCVALVVSLQLLSISVCAEGSEILLEPGVDRHYDYDNPVTWTNVLNDYSNMSWDDFSLKYFSSNPLNDVIDNMSSHYGDNVYDFGKFIYDTVWGRIESNINAYDRPRLGHESDESYWSDGKKGCFGVYKLPDGDYPNQHLDHMRLKIMYYAIGADADTIAKSKAVANVCNYNSGGHINSLWIEAVTRTSGARFKIDFAYRTWGGTRYSTTRSYCYYTFPSSAVSDDTVFNNAPVTVLPKVTLYPKTSPYGGDDGIDGTIDYDDGGIYITYNGSDYYIDNSDHSVVIDDINYYIFPHITDLNYDLQNNIYYDMTSSIVNNFAYTYNNTYVDVDMSGIIAILSSIYGVDVSIYNSVAALFNLNTDIYNKITEINVNVGDLTGAVNNISLVIDEIKQYLQISSETSIDYDQLNKILLQLQTSLDSGDVFRYDVKDLLTNINTLLCSIAQGDFNLNLDIDSDGDGITDISFAQIMLDLSKTIDNINNNNSVTNKALENVTNNFTNALSKLDIIIQLLQQDPVVPDPDDPSAGAADDIDYLEKYIELVTKLKGKIPYEQLNNNIKSLTGVVFTNSPPADIELVYDGVNYKLLSVSDLNSDIVFVIRCLLAVFVLLAFLFSMRRKLSDVF